MEKDIQKEVERFFKEKGLEEEVKKLTDLFTDRYTIRGEVTEDLRHNGSNNKNRSAPESPAFPMFLRCPLLLS